MIKLTRSAFPKIWAVALVGSAAFTLVGTASAQFSTDFQNGYARDNSFGGTEQGWTTNDIYTGATYNGGQGTIGSTDDISFINGFSSPTTDLSASVGGNFAPSGVSGHPTVLLGHSLALGSASPNVSVNLDFEVTTSGGSFATHDSFGFGLTDVNGASLFTLNFVPSATDATFDNVTFTTATGQGTSGRGFFLNTKLHLTLSVNQSNSTFSAILGGTTILTNQPYTGGTLAGFSAIWNLADTNTTSPGSGGVGTSTAYTDPGSNFLAFDNIVTSVPEPSTYALLGAGALCLAGVVRRRVV